MTPQKAQTTPEQPQTRKAWVRKTPAEIVIEQFGRQETRVQQLREELAIEERELQKLQTAREVLESK